MVKCNSEIKGVDFIKSGIEFSVRAIGQAMISSGLMSNVMISHSNESEFKGINVIDSECFNTLINLVKF